MSALRHGVVRLRGTAWRHRVVRVLLIPLGQPASRKCSVNQTSVSRPAEGIHGAVCVRATLEICRGNASTFALVQLEGREFQWLGSLQELHLGQNALDHIPPGAFAGLARLRKLFLYNNNLSSLDRGALAGPANLTALLLNNNLLRLIAQDTFAAVPRLKKL